MNEIEQALTRLFERHRIVFWYDHKRELRPEYEATNLPDVVKVMLDQTPFGLKYRLLRQEPDQKFLLYHEGPPPPDLDNWLLDIQLAQGEFRADQTALWLHELGLPLEFDKLIGEHSDFFKATPRREALKRLLRPQETERLLRLKMTAVCAGAEPRLDDIVEALLAELAGQKEEKIRLLRRCGLEPFLWQQVEREYGYHSGTPGVRDFALALFKAGYYAGLGEVVALNNDALVFLKRWKDSVRHRPAFITLAPECSRDLDIQADLSQRDVRQLLEMDYFELIEQKILSDLVGQVERQTINAAACEQVVRLRAQSIWYEPYADMYEAVNAAAQFFHLLDKADLTPRSPVQGIQQYSQSWYRLDQLYRQFIHHARQSRQVTMLGHLQELVENRYTNHFLLPLNNRWQDLLDAPSGWGFHPLLRQSDFYQERVQPFLDRGNKVFVIISDALRYEIGAELIQRIRQEDRYDATIEPAVALLPSFTQLGMAALLPHTSLVLSDDGKTVIADGQPTGGLENRKKILAQALARRGTAIRAEEMLNMGKEESRAFIRDHDVVYVYHNRIDAVGDKRDSEEKVFEAAAETLNELVLLIKKLVNANASNVLVTADHGFIYQHNALEESDFSSQEATGQEIVVLNRRFVLGHGLVETSGFKRFHPGDMSWHGTLELLIPKSINRLRVRGAGSRYVHGGATLQEIVIPVIQINKKRQSDLNQVTVDILRGASGLITAGQLAVSFYQTEAVTDKLRPRTVRAGLYTQSGKLISDSHELVFDFTVENPRERERSVQFILTRQADEANGQDVILRLEERVPDTSHYREYKSVRYLLRRSFTSDFDF